MVTCGRWIAARMTARSLPRAPRPLGLVFCFRPPTAVLGLPPACRGTSLAKPTPRRAPLVVLLSFLPLTPRQGAQAKWLCHFAYCVCTKTLFPQPSQSPHPFSIQNPHPPNLSKPSNLQPLPLRNFILVPFGVLAWGRFGPGSWSWDRGPLRPSYTRTGSGQEARLGGGTAGGGFGSGLLAVWNPGGRAPPGWLLGCSAVGAFSFPRRRLFGSGAFGPLGGRFSGRFGPGFRPARGPSSFS